MAQPKIAELIRADKHRIIDTWIVAVREDPRINSDANLSTPELIDHIPAILEEICDLLRKGEVPGVRNTLEARASVYTRISQGYSGRDIVRELSLFRVILIDLLLDIYLDSHHDISPTDRHEADLIVNLYIDEELRYAISVYSDLGDRRSSSEPDKPM